MAQTSRLVKPETAGARPPHACCAPSGSRRTGCASRSAAARSRRFRPMGYDQWFRLFLPLGGDAGLDRLPAKANKMFGYLKYLRIPDGVRPVMRNYTVRAYRPATAERGAEIDVDFVLHGSAADGTAGPASRWAETCEPGESVVHHRRGSRLQPGARHRARPARRRRDGPAGDRGDLRIAARGCHGHRDHRGAHRRGRPRRSRTPAGVDVRWIVREHDAKPGAPALARSVAVGCRAAGIAVPRVHRGRAGAADRAPAATSSVSAASTRTS